MATRKKANRASTSRAKPNLDPSTQALNSIQVQRLSSLSGLDPKKISGLNIAEISDKFRFELDLTLLFYRKVCGQVVKVDPNTGVQHPVPFARVEVEDTDCNFISYAPSSSPYLWLYPFGCRREVIATAITDQCGRFCVNIPRWDIDWILKWRKQRICFPEILLKPSIGDILDRLVPRIPEFPPRPQPRPDPPPWIFEADDLMLSRAREALGDGVVTKLQLFQEELVFGQSSAGLKAFLDSPAYSKSLPPQLPDDITNDIQVGGKPQEHGKLKKAALTTINSEIRATSNITKALSGLQIDRFIGPFFRCFDIFTPQWSTVIDVPDITFKVLQDVDGDEQVIYSEGHFDVRWNSGDIPDLTLEASQIALASPLTVANCDGPGDLPCEEPQIVMAGLMPLHNLPSDPVPYHDQTSGYARRPNRPHPTGSFTTPTLPLPPPDNLLATAPFTDTLQLYGCNQHQGAKYYRICYRYNGNAPQHFAGHSWNLFRWVGSPGHLEVKSVVPDTAGWYEIIPVSEQWLPSHLLLSWPSNGYQNGLYDVYMELGNNSKSVIHTTADIGIRIDNTWNGNNNPGSVTRFATLRWKHVGAPESEWQSLLVTCPVIRRQSGQDIEIEVGIDVAAPHLRSILLWGGGCGGTHPQLTSSLPVQWERHLGTRGLRHWHTSAFDNSYNNALTPFRYTIDASALSGVYGFHLTSHSRAFNPSGGDAGFNLDWHYNPGPNRAYANLQFAVVDA
jgi:hypothetical protein